MSDYKYTDRDGDELSISSGLGTFSDGLYIRADSGDGAVSVRVEGPEAPAVALAILEAAGIEARAYTSDNDEEAAAYSLKMWQARQGQAERVAEDAKVRDWHRAVFPGEYTLNDWPVSDEERGHYRVAQAFPYRDETRE